MISLSSWVRGIGFSRAVLGHLQQRSAPPLLRGSNFKRHFSAVAPLSASSTAAEVGGSSTSRTRSLTAPQPSVGGRQVPFLTEDHRIEWRFVKGLRRRRAHDLSGYDLSRAVLTA